MTFHLALIALAVCGALYALLQCLDTWLVRREARKAKAKAQRMLVQDFRSRQQRRRPL